MPSNYKRPVLIDPHEEPERAKVAARIEHRSERSDWGTPEYVLEAVRSVAPIGLDPATSADNPTGADLFYTIKDDGLTLPWTDRGLVYCNCPYGREKNFRCQEWVSKAVEEAERGAEIIMLLPARTDTGWFHKLFESATALCFVRGRLVFVGADAGAPFPSAFAYFGTRPRVFRGAFKSMGYVTDF